MFHYVVLNAPLLFSIILSLTAKLPYGQLVTAKIFMEKMFTAKKLVAKIPGTVCVSNWIVQKKRQELAPSGCWCPKPLPDGQAKQLKFQRIMDHH